MADIDKKDIHDISNNYRDTHDHDLTYENEKSTVTIPLIEELLQDIRELRNEMVQKNWPAQRLSNIILKYEMKLNE
tara:strand:+ start:95 stop:322 length:228 start_codon:yes stop_codon:yes gene_type:complete